MNILVAVLLTILAIVNLLVIGVIAWAIKKNQNKNSRIGGMILLFVIIIDILSAAGGLLL